MKKVLVDTSILLEPFVPWKNNEPNYKGNALALLKGRLHSFNKRFKMLISMSVIGELFVIINDKPSMNKIKEEKREIMEKILGDFLKSTERVGITKQSIRLCNEILNLDERIDPLDALHLSIALAEGCYGFLVMDNGLKENSKLRKYLKEKGLLLIIFNIKENKDNKRLSGNFIMQE